MKSMLRMIRRDIRSQFFHITSFDFKIKTNRLETFTECLNIYSPFIFGQNPSTKQVLILGKNQFIDIIKEKK